MSLLPGEAVGLAEPGPIEVATSDALINEKYVRGEVRIVTEQARYPLNSIPQLIAGGSYLLRPEYQRRHRWSPAKKSRLIESLIMNVPIPPIFLYEYEYSRYEVMDGLQRLSTIDEFYRDAFELVELSEWPELTGRTYATLPSAVRAGIDRRYLSSIILLQETARNAQEAQVLKQLVFERINSGGERLTPQESRNATYGGPMNDLCLVLSRHPDLCECWGIPAPEQWPATSKSPEPEDALLLENNLYREMYDVELVLRFFAFRQDPQYLAGSLRDYFDSYLKKSNTYPAQLLQELGSVFTRTIELAYALFGEKAFWLWRQRGSHWNWYSRPTTVAYDTMMFVLSANLHLADNLIAVSDSLIVAFPQFYEANYADFAGRYTNVSNIRRRRELFATWLAEQLGQDVVGHPTPTL